MAKEESPRYEIPADMRALAEKSVEQAKLAFEIFVSAAQHAVSTERNIASSFTFAQKLLQAREAKDVMALHTEYVNSQISALTEQGKELSKRVTKTAGQGVQPP